MHLHFERTAQVKSDCTILSLTWMGKVPDELPEDEGWKLNRTNYYQEGWLATGNIRGIVGVTFTTSHCKKNVDFPVRTNYNLRGHRSEVILVKWNEPYQKLASCDSSGIIFVWIKYEGRWSIELINDRNTPVTHFSWSHGGRMALICYQDGFVLVGSVAGQRYWSSMLNLDGTITCGIWTPDDQQVYFGTTTGQIIVMDIHGAMVSQVQLCSEVGITLMAWSCEKFRMEEGDDMFDYEGVTYITERKCVLAVALQNGFIFLLKTFDDVSPIQIDTGLQGPLCMEWSNSKELLAVAGVSYDTECVDLQIHYKNMVRFYNEKGVHVYCTTIPCCQAPVSAMTWGHNDKRLFLATGTQVHIAWISRRIGTLQLLCRLRIRDAIQDENLLPALPLPIRIRNSIGNLFAQTVRCFVPEPSALKEFVSRPPIDSARLHCTMIRHDTESNSTVGVCYTLYLEYLGGLVPLLKGKRVSKIRPEFVIFDPENGDKCVHGDATDKCVHGDATDSAKKDLSSESSYTSPSTSTDAPLISDSSDSDCEEGCTGSPILPRRKKRFNLCTRSATPQDGAGQSGEQSSGGDGGDQEDLTYIDTLPEHVKLAEVRSNIWGTKFKFHGLANSSVPANLGKVTYKTSLLHLQPRQMTLVITELRDDFPIGPDPTFNPNLFSEDEDDPINNGLMMDDGKTKIPRVAIDNSPPIAPMSPRTTRLGKPNSLVTSRKTLPPPSLTKAELNEDPCHHHHHHSNDLISFCDSIRPPSSSSSSSPTQLRPNSSTTSFVGQFNNTRNTTGNSGSQKHHAISPLCCEGSVPALQSPKNAVAPSDMIFERPPATYGDCYSSSSNNVQQIKSNVMLHEQRNIHNGEPKPFIVASNKSKSVNNKDISFIDDDAAAILPGPSTAIAPSTTDDDSMVRSCSVGFLDMVDAQLVPSDVALLMLRKEVPKRLVLVNRKQNQKTKRQSRQIGRRQDTTNSKKSPKLKGCGKSKSLDSSDLVPNDGGINVKNLANHIEEVIPETPNNNNKSCSSSSADTVDENSNSTLVNKKENKLGFFSGRSPLMRRKKTNENDNKSRNRTNKQKSNHQQSEQNQRNGGTISLHSQALANLEKLIMRLREDDRQMRKSTKMAASQRLPKSSPASPAPCKKGKRPQSTSPIRRALFSSPLLGGRRNKNKYKQHQDSSDDEFTASGDEFYTGMNYRDLETFQKAQLRQKLKRGKIEPNGSCCNSSSAISQRREFVMHNKAPMWNENSQVYQLDFGGRVTQESAKNFQIEFRGKQVMQFGRIDGNAYTLDFQYPFSALQAFAVALANVTQRLK